jgi:predicted HTH domain antitoxin
MRTRSLRLPEELLAAITVVEEKEHLDEAPAIRKLLRLGIEAYVADLYRDGQLTLREAASRLGLSPAAALDVLRERGVPGNLTASDVIAAMDRFV